MKKAVLVSVLMLMICVFAFSAGQSDQESKGPIVLRVFWNPSHLYEPYQRVFQEFEAEKNVKIQLEQYRWDELRQKLVASFVAGDPPDMSEDASDAIKYGKLGYLAPINEFESPEFFKDWQDSSMKRNSSDGNIWALQIHLTGIGVYANETLLKNAGLNEVPGNWDDFLAAAKKTTDTENGVYGFVSNKDVWWTYPWILQAGAELYDTENKKMTINTPEFVKAWTFLQDLIHRHKVAPRPDQAVAGYEGPSNLFKAGRAAMILDGPWSYTPIEKAGPEFEWCVAEPFSNKTQRTASGGSGVIIPKGDNQELAWELLKRLVDVEVEVEISKKNLMTMPRRSWAKNAEVMSDPVLNVFAKTVAVSYELRTPFMAMGTHKQIQDIIQTAHDRIILGAEDSQTVLDEANLKCEELLKEFK